MHSKAQIKTLDDSDGHCYCQLDQIWNHLGNKSPRSTVRGCVDQHLAMNEVG